MERFISFIGILVFLGLAWLLSNNRKKISLKIIFWGMGLQFITAILVLGIPAIEMPGVLAGLFFYANKGFLAFLGIIDQGTDFLFGSLNNANLPHGFIFAVKVLPTIIVFSSLMAIGYYLKIMQAIVRVFAFVMRKTMGTSGSETLSVSANIFVGQTEAPLLVKPYISSMTKSELMAVMTGGFATVAGGVMASYVSFLHEAIPNIAGHLMTASVISAPAALVLAKIIFPETEKSLTAGTVRMEDKSTGGDVNIIEAAARGAFEGMQLAFNVGAMLLAFVALIALLNAILGGIGEHVLQFSSWGQSLVPEVLSNGETAKLSLQLILGWLFAPFAWVMGIPWHEAPLVGALLGEKLALNEFVSYIHLSQQTDKLSDRTIIITSYALCGFANFSSIAIQIGGIGGIAPDRRSDLARLGIRAVIAGTLAAYTTACIAGILI